MRDSKLKKYMNVCIGVSCSRCHDVEDWWYQDEVLKNLENIKDELDGLCSSLELDGWTVVDGKVVCGNCHRG